MGVCALRAVEAYFLTGSLKTSVACVIIILCTRKNHPNNMKVIPRNQASTGYVAQLNTLHVGRYAPLSTAFASPRHTRQKCTWHVNALFGSMEERNLGTDQTLNL